jgi:hypothetical protein
MSAQVCIEEGRLLTRTATVWFLSEETNQPRRRHHHECTDELRIGLQELLRKAQLEDDARNSYRHRRDWDTKVGTIELSGPRVRDSSYFPSLLEPRRRAERALTAVVQEAYVQGVSTRKVDDLVKALGMRAGISKKSRVSELSTRSSTRRLGASATESWRDPTPTSGSTPPT